MEYGYKEIAEMLGVTELTVRRRIKNLGIEGVLIDRPEGGKKRVFTKVDVERLKANDRPLDLPVTSSEGGLSDRSNTELSPVYQTGLSEQDRSPLGMVLTSLAVLPELKTLVEGLVEANQVLQGQLVALQDAQQKQNEDWATLRQALQEAQAQTQRREDRYRSEWEEARKREEELQAQLAEARQETLQQLASFQEAAQQREAELSAQVQAIQQGLRQPWWRRLRSRKKPP